MPRLQSEFFTKATSPKILSVFGVFSGKILNLNQKNIVVTIIASAV